MNSLPQTLELAMKHHRAGDLHHAELLYRQILQIDPRHVDALHLLGLIAHQVGRNDLAIDHIGQALRIQPQFPEAHASLGSVLKDQGKLEEAIASYQRALRLKPDFAKAHHNLGTALHDQGKLKEAIASYQRALRLKPDFADAYRNLGNALRDEGRLGEAIASFQQTLRLSPHDPHASFFLANALKAQGRLDEAIASYQLALRLKPDYAEAYNNQGNALRDLGRLDEAVASYRQALRIKPHDAEAFNNLGNTLIDQDRFDEAIDSYRQAVGLRPDYAEAYVNLSNALKDQGKLDEAIASCRHALRVRPNLAEAHYCLGNSLREQGKLEESLASYRQAIVLKPDFAEAHYNVAALLLSQGDFAHGWQEYEWRWRLPRSKPRDFPEPMWEGEPLSGRTILLHAEQGIGDTLQFVRFAKHIKARGAGKVLLECSPNFARLLKDNADVETLWAPGSPLPHFDVHLPLLSLPRVLKTTSETIPADVPYLSADPELIQRWQKRIADSSISDFGLRIVDSNAVPLSFNPQFRVGIAWQGNPEHQGDRRRSVSLARFAGLAEIPGVRLVSLQKGFGSEQLKQRPGLAVDLGSELDDLADTAAVLKCLDLVVSVDSAVVHLAGALAVPVRLALPFNPDWRWLLDRDDSPWYPTMRIFRQPRFGDWDDVFARIQSALTEIVTTSNTTLT